MILTLLGTGCPKVDHKRFGPSNLISSLNTKILVDCGSGVTQRLEQLKKIFGDKIIPEQSDKIDLKKLISECVLLIGGVLIPGAEAPKLVTKDMLKIMKRGSVIVDVAIDQGGCIETSKPTTHANPTYICLLYTSPSPRD